MPNFRVATAVSGGSQTVSVRNGTGQVEFFTTGSDNTVWNFYPDAASDTGFSGVSTGLSAGTVAAGVDGAGNIVLFAPNGLQLNYICETGNLQSRWSKPQTVSLPQPLGAIKIAQVMTTEVGGNLYVAVMTQYQSALGNMYAVAYSNWQTESPVFQNSSMRVDSLNCAWVGNTAQTVAFACIDGVIAALTASTGAVINWPLAASFQSESVDASVDGLGNNQIFAVLTDGNLYHLVGGGQNAFSWAQLTQSMTLRQTIAVTDGAGDVQVFAISGNNILYHFSPLTNSSTGYGSAAALVPNIGLAGAARNDGGDVELFAIGTSSASLTHLIQEETTGNWLTQALEVPTGTQVEQYISYTTDVTVFDSAGAAAVSQPVRIWTSEESQITVNGATFYTDPNHPAITSTNSAGILSIAQQTNTLSIPVIDLNIPALMSPNQTLTIEQSADVQQRLTAVSGTDLMNATDAGGNPLLPTQYRNTATTDSMAAAFKNCMTLAGGSLAAESHPFFKRHGAKSGVWIKEARNTVPRRISPVGEQHWRLKFGAGGAMYEVLTADQAQVAIRQAHVSFFSAGFFDWIGDIGDFVEGIVEGIVEVVDTVVSAVSGAVQAVFTFIVDGITYVYDAVVTFVEQAFDIVQGFFAQVLVAFEKVFEWLAFLFQWPDILRTHEALAYTMNQFMGFLQGAAAGIQGVIDAGIANVQSQISALFDQAIASIAGTSSVGGYDATNQQPNGTFSSSTANNPLYNGFIDNAGSATTSSLSLAAEDFGSIQAMIQQFLEFASQTESAPAFSQALDYFKNLSGSPDEIFTQLLSGMFRVVQGVLQAIITGVQVLVDGLFQLIQSLIAGMQSLLNAEWDIPFVSTFYGWITDGAKLTTLDLFALVIAIPTTPIYKILKGSAPFPDSASVTAFENAFNSQTMLQASGLGARNDSLAVDGSLLTPQQATLVMVGGTVSSCFYTGFSALLDAQPPLDIPTPLLTYVGYAAFAAEALQQVCGLPWFTNPDAPDCTTTNGKNATHWIYQCVGVLLDLGFLLGANAIPENLSDAGVIVSFLYGVGDLIMAIIASVGQSGLPVAANILAVIPELTKIGRLKQIVTATDGISLPVVAGCDAIFMLAATILNFIAGSSSSETAEVIGLAAGEDLAVAY